MEGKTKRCIKLHLIVIQGSLCALSHSCQKKTWQKESYFA